MNFIIIVLVWCFVVATNVVGSVTAQLLLDTKEFNAQLNGVKNQVKDLNNAFKYSNASKMAEEIERLHKQLKKSSDVIKEQEQIIDKLKKGYDNLRGEVDSLNKVSENLRMENEKLAKTNDGLVSSNEKLGNSYDKVASKKRKLDDILKSPSKGLLEGLSKEFKSGVANLDWGLFENKFLKVINKGFRADGSQFIRSIDVPAIKSARAEFQALIQSMVSTYEEMITLSNQFTLLENTVNQEVNALNKLKTHIKEIGEVARKGGEDVARFHAQVSKLNNLKTIPTTLTNNNAMTTLNSQLRGFAGIEEWESYLQRWSETSGKVTSGMSAFAQSSEQMRTSLQESYNALKNVTAILERFDEIINVGQQSLKRFGTTTPNLNSFKMNLNEVYELMAQNGTVYERNINESKRWSDAVKSSAVTLQDYYTQMEKVTTASNDFIRQQEVMAQSSRALGTALLKDIPTLEKYRAEILQMESFAKQGKKFSVLDNLVPKNLQGEITRIRELMAQLGLEEWKLEQQTSKTTAKMESLNGATGKLKQGLSALKMTISMISSMFIWTFGMSLWEATKQTVQSKNEMESYLERMGMSKGSIAVFNKGLDDTVARFKKLNKYMVGETIAGIGMEFDLSARQMTKAMDVVAMIQNEYVRAGRKEEEATLAVKDILQGEFLRLSRETGVGKQDLIDTGLWSGDLKDIEGLMDALRQVGTDRHWDLFASKCTSLSDVVSATKNRISEFTATLIDEASPLIVGAFNNIMGVVDWLTNGWEKMGASMKLLTSGGIITALITGILMIGKNMGLVQIATNGFTNSLVAMILKMEASQVKSLGLLKSITMTITGLEAETVANQGVIKSLAIRLLGLDANIVKEYGFATAIKVAKAELVGEKAMTEASVLGHQKLTTVLKESILTWKALKIAIMSVIAIGIIVWLGEIAQECNRAKESVETFYEVVDSGSEIIEETQGTYEKYVDIVAQLDEKLSGLEEGSAEYNKVLNQRNTALHNQWTAYKNLGNIQLANAKAEEYNAKLQQKMTDINLGQQNRMIKIYEELGYSTDEATEKSFKYAQEVENGYNIISEAYDMYEAKLTQASGHMEIQSKKLQEVGATQEQVNRYLRDYNAEAYRVAQYWSDFKQGDFWAIFKVALGELTLMWIDIANHPEVVKLMNGLGKACEEFAPVIDWIADGLAQIGLYLAKATNWLLSTSLGRSVASWTVFGVAIGVVVLKLKGLISKIPKAIKGVKDLTTAVEESSVLGSGGGSIPTKGKTGSGGTTGGTTGGKNSPVYTDWGDDWKGNFGKAIKSDFLDNARMFLKVGTMLVEAMLLITLAIEMIKLPMWSLARVGEEYAKIEPQLKQGIEGLKTIAPVILALLPPVIGLMAVMDKFGKAITYDRLIDAGGKSVVGIAIGLGLVAETIAMIIPSIIALGSLGKQAQKLGDATKQGVEAIKLVGEAIYSLVPTVPFLITGIVLAIAIFESGLLGGILTVAVVGGIALGMGMLAFTIATLQMPLSQIGEIGKKYKDLSNVKQGAEAIKQTGIALQYLADATGSIGKIAWDSLATFFLTNGQPIEEVVTSLTDDGNIIDALSKFADKFSDLEITPIDSAKVSQLSTLAEGVTTIGEGLTKVYQALNDLAGQQMINGTYQQDYDSDETKSLLTMQLEDLEKVMTDISDYATRVNELTITPVNSAISSAISQTADAIGNIQNAVDKLKATMSGIADANWGGAMASGGLWGAIGNFIGHGGDPSTGYTSSLGTPLIALQRAVQDIFTFNTNINNMASQYGGDSSSSVSTATDTISRVSQIISDLTTELAGGIEEVKASGQDLGKAITDGIATGIDNGMGSMKTNAVNQAKGMGKSMTDAFREEVNNIPRVMNQELVYTGQRIDNMKPTLEAKAKSLGAGIVEAFKDGLDAHSPALLSRTMGEEMDYIYEAIASKSSKVVGAVSELASNISSTFTSSATMELNGTDNLGEYRADSMLAMNMANQTVTTTETAFSQLDTQTALTFNSIGGTIGNTMTNIANTTKSNYNQVALTTKSQLANMQSETTKNINQIKDSWGDMQTALIQSAEHIRSETSSKIHSLQNNMATFWRKVQNPALLLGSAGNPYEPRRAGKQRFSRQGGGVRRILSPKGYAGGGSPTKGGSGISDKKFPLRNGDASQLDFLAEYLKCLQNGENCFAGGWNFDWSKNIKDAMMTWHTHFGAIYDPYLVVGKFENDNFPVRGIPQIAKNYIYDAISRTTYEGYFNSKYGDPISIWNAGHFNCYDGAILVMALARALGFPNSHMVHGSWAGIPHVWARIQGLGDIDATAIQGGYGFTAPSRTGVGNSNTLMRSAGSLNQSFKHNKMPLSDNTSNTINGDVHIHINGDGMDSKEIGEEVRNVVLDLFSPNPSTGH